MIDEILKEVDQRFGDNFSSKTGMERAQIPQALQVISSTVMAKAKQFIDNNQLLELKDVFLSSDEAKKQGFMNEIKELVSSALSSNLQTSADTAQQLTELSVPEIIKISKEKLLGPNGKVTLMDYPKLLSFFKSEGKEVKSSGGFGGLFG